jgi:hypothetical protein
MPCDVILCIKYSIWDIYILNLENKPDILGGHYGSSNSFIIQCFRIPTAIARLVIGIFICIACGFIYQINENIKNVRDMNDR